MCHSTARPAHRLCPVADAARSATAIRSFTRLFGKIGRLRRAFVWVAFATLVLAFVEPSAAWAHFNLTAGLRVVHVAPAAGGLQVFMRVPLPLVVAGAYADQGLDIEVVAAPYTTNTIEDGQRMHYFDAGAFVADPLGLGRLVADGHHLTVNGRRLVATVQQVRAHPITDQPRITTLAEARAALDGPVFGPVDDAFYAGEIVVDVALFYPTDTPVKSYEFSSSFAPDLDGIDRLTNMLIDHLGDTAWMHRAAGTLATPIAVVAGASPDAAAAPMSWGETVTAFIWQGMLHIWEGIDHVLFVLCLTIGALGLTNLLWRVTGFTLGHTVTLIAGFFGLAPESAWFIPTIESAIALSIVYAGVIALLRKAAAATFVVTALIGLLHGFGFSFVLHNILQVDSPNLLSSLIAFNVGVEIGQLCLILVIWPLLIWVQRHSEQIAGYARIAIAAPCIAVAAWWTVQRLGLIWTAVT